MADLHGQTLVTELGTAQRIAAGEQGQTGAVNILPENLRLQFTAPTTGQTFTGGNIDLGNLRGTYYTAFNQSGNITFTFTNPVNGGNAFIRINSNGTGTFTFTSVEAFGVASGGTLPAGNHLFRFLQTPYGVSVAILRDAGTPRGAANGLSLVSNNIEIGGSNITKQTQINIDSGQSFTISDQTAGTRLSFSLVSNSTAGQPGAFSFGDVNGVSIELDPANLLGQGAGYFIRDSRVSPRGITGGADFSANAQDLDYVQKSYVDPGTPAQRITALTSTANATSIDFLSQSRFKEFSLTLSENTTVSFANATSRSSYKIFLIISGATRTITLPVGSLMPVSTSNSSDIIWTASTRELQLNVGGYELVADYNGTNDFWKITDRYA